MWSTESKGERDGVHYEQRRSALCCESKRERERARDEKGDCGHAIQENGRRRWVQASERLSERTERADARLSPSLSASEKQQQVDGEGGREGERE